MENKDKISNLPKNWVLTTISNISLNLTDGSHTPPRKSDSGIPMLSAKNIQNGFITFEDVRYITPTEFELENNRAKLETGDVLLTIVGSIGRSAVINDFNNYKFAVQRSVAIIKPAIVSKFLMYVFQSPNFQKKLTDNSKGTAQKGIYLKTLNSLEIPLPPLAEQHRIVDKIEELFSELDKAEESLLNAQKQLEIYKQVILKNAFKRNDITEYKQHLSEVGDLISGQHIISGNYSDSKKGTPYLTGPSDFGERYPSITKWTEKPLVTCLKDDILVTVKGSGVGKINIAQEEYAIGRQLMAYRFKKGISDFIYYFFLSIEKELNKISSGTAIPGISRKDILNYICQIPSIEEQKQIVQEIEYRFTLIDNLKKSVADNLKRIGVFRQTILKKAFSGKLVLQNENYESASNFLLQIKNEKQIYEKTLKISHNNRVVKNKIMKSDKSIKEVLEQAKVPIETKLVWQMSKHKDDIENFYEELKFLSENIQEIRDGKISKLTLKNENR